MIQIALSEPPKDIERLLKRTAQQFKRYKLITEWDPEHKEFYDSIPEGEEWHWLRSDVIRFEYMAKNEHVLYLDWDVRVNWIPYVDEVFWAPKFDYWAVYNADKTHEFGWILDEGIKLANRRPPKATIKRSWLSFFIERVGGNTFPEDCMEHI